MAQAVEFLGAMFGARLIEVIAAACGLVCVVLIIRRSLWNYPFGIAMVILYAWIFYDVRLYSDALLQVFFLIVQLFGVYWWLNGRAGDGRVRPVRLPASAMIVWAAGAALASAALGYVMATRTDADLPYWDAVTTVLSMVAQYLMARRYLQNWLVWIVVDVLAIGIYWTKGLTPTAALYAVFLALAIAGYFSWRRAMTPEGDGDA
jgi:nicotinamide mononucleotide transporter